MFITQLTVKRKLIIKCDALLF